MWNSLSLQCIRYLYHFLHSTSLLYLPLPTTYLLSLTPYMPSARSLHAKLSSPDRRRAISPTELRSKQEAKQQSAELNRDKTLAGKRLKAMQVSDRVKLRGEREKTR